MIFFAVAPTRIHQHTLRQTLFSLHSNYDRVGLLGASTSTTLKSEYSFTEDKRQIGAASEDGVKAGVVASEVAAPRGAPSSWLFCQTFYSFARNEVKDRNHGDIYWRHGKDAILRQTDVRTEEGSPSIFFFYGVWMELPGLRNLISVFMTYNEITAVLLDCYCLLILLGFLSVFNLIHLPIYIWQSQFFSSFLLNWFCPLRGYS